MPRQDDYKNAFKLAASEIQEKDPFEVSRLSLAEYDEEKSLFLLDFIGRPHAVTFPEVTVRRADSDQEPPITEQVLILHYLNQAQGTPFKNELITYREVPAGEFYYSAFFKRAEAPMLSVFGRNPDLLLKTGPQIGAEPVPDQGDAAVRVRALPRVPVTLVIWGGDEEFEPSGKILFDRCVSGYLSTEDIAWVSGMIVYRLMRLASQTSGGQ